MTDVTATAMRTLRQISKRLTSRCGLPEHVDGQSPEAFPEGKGLLPGVKHVSGHQPGAKPLGEVA